MSSPVPNAATSRRPGVGTGDAEDRPHHPWLACEPAPYPRVKAVRTQVATTVASAAGPYGYTITLGGSTALASNALGPPHLGSALLMMSGAAPPSVALGAAARGVADPPAGDDPPPPSPLANAHVPSA